MGLLSCAFTTTACIPQLARTWRTRSAHDLSWGYIAVTGAGMLTWFIYGLLTGDQAVIFTNVVTATMLTALGALKFATPRV